MHAGKDGETHLERRLRMSRHASGGVQRSMPTARASYRPTDVTVMTASPRLRINWIDLLITGDFPNAGDIVAGALPSEDLVDPSFVDKASFRLRLLDIEDDLIVRRHLLYHVHYSASIP